MAEVQGTCDKRFNAVRTALAELLDDTDVGAAAAVFVDGEPVADLWGGFTDAERTESWQRDTITNVRSTTKTMVALCALIPSCSPPGKAWARADSGDSRSHHASVRDKS